MLLGKTTEDPPELLAVEQRGCQVFTRRGLEGRQGRFGHHEHATEEAAREGLERIVAEATRDGFVMIDPDATLDSPFVAQQRPTAGPTPLCEARVYVDGDPHRRKLTMSEARVIARVTEGLRPIDADEALAGPGVLTGPVNQSVLIRMGSSLVWLAAFSAKFSVVLFGSDGIRWDMVGGRDLRQLFYTLWDEKLGGESEVPLRAFKYQDRVAWDALTQPFDDLCARAADCSEDPAWRKEAVRRIEARAAEA